MLADLLKSKESLAALILRSGLAAIFIVHGYIKVEVDTLLAPNAISMNMQRAVGWLELISGLLLLGGLCTRVAAGVLIVLQIAAIVLVSGKYAMEGVRLAPKGENYMLVGPEYNLVLIAMCLCLLVLGGGVASLDRMIANARRGTTTATTSVAPTEAEKPAGSVPAV
jgi:putative oxidoreductase